MNHLRAVQTRNVVVSNVMMSNAPKMTCPGDPRAQTHTQIVRAYLRFAAKQADTDHAAGRERFFESVGAFDIAHTVCTPHTRQLHT